LPLFYPKPLLSLPPPTAPAPRFSAVFFLKEYIAALPKGLWDRYQFEAPISECDGAEGKEEIYSLIWHRVPASNTNAGTLERFIVMFKSSFSPRRLLFFELMRITKRQRIVNRGFRN
jgi:hypothetical protein